MSIEKINSYLARDFGYFNGELPKYRVVWSEDVMEKRLSKFTDEGFELINELVMEKPKYQLESQKNKYILERCLAIPDFVKTDLIGGFSYEPLHVFRIGKGDDFEFDTFYGSCKWLIEQIHLAAGRAFYGANYKAPEEKRNPEENLLAKRAEVEKMAKFLYPDESEIADAMHYGEGVSVPNNYAAKGTSLIKEN
jgi:hypothetical protein